MNLTADYFSVSQRINSSTNCFCSNIPSLSLSSYLQSLEDLAPALVAGCGNEGLEDVAASGVGCQCLEVGGAQGAQAAEKGRTVLELGQCLDQPGAVVADGGQWDLEMWGKTTVIPHCICGYYLASVFCGIH